MLIKKIVTISALMMFIVPGCTKSPVIVVKAGAGEQMITAKAGEAFTIQLEGQLSTGYAWKLAESPASVQIIKESVLTEGNDKAGGIDIQEFVLKSTAKGELTLTFKYARHWEKKPVYIKTSTVKVKVE